MNMGCCNGGYHEFNLDWFIKRFREIEDKFDKDFESTMEQYFDQYFDKIMIDALYEDPETLVLKKEIKVTNAEHYVNDMSFIVEEKE